MNHFQTARYSRARLCFCLAMMIGLLGFSEIKADVVVFTPDTLAEFQTPITSGFLFKNTEDDGSGSSVVVSNPSSTVTDQAGGVLRFTTEIDAADRVLYRHNLIGSTFDPSAVGAINDVDFSLDIRDPGIGSSDTFLVFGLVQGGNTYFYTDQTGVGVNYFRFRNNGNSPNFDTFTATNLTATDFGIFGGSNRLLVDQTQNPDFSLAGSDIQWVIAATSSSSGGTPTRNTDIRNGSITVDFEPIPEPASLALLGLGGLCLIRRKRA